MDLYTSVGVVALLILVSILGDYQQKIKSERDPNIELDPNNNFAGTVVMFTPFVALFYSDQFYLALLLMSALVLYGYVLVTLAKHYGLIGYGSEIIRTVGPGSIMLSVIGYYLFFHSGSLSNEITVQPVKQDLALNFWPLYVYGGLILLAAIMKWAANKSEKIVELNEMAVIVAIVILNILPFFTHFYWWAMLISFIVFIIIFITLMGVHKDPSVKGAFGFVVGYVFMLISGVNIAVYAIFF